MGLMDNLAAQGITAEDIEKAASARLFEQAAAQEGIDLSTLNDDQVGELYNVWAGAAPEAAKTASAGEIEEAQAKLAEAEILGRYMARSYMDEMGKTAGIKQIGKAGVGKRVMAKLHHLKGQAKELATGHEAARTRAREIATRQRSNAANAMPGQESFRSKSHDQIERGERLKGYAKRVGAVGGAVGGAGTLAAGAHHMSKKEGSDIESFDELALQLANEILVATGTVEKEASAEDVTLDDALAARALEILEANGYDTSSLTE